MHIQLQRNRLHLGVRGAPKTGDVPQLARHTAAGVHPGLHGCLLWQPGLAAALLPEVTQQGLRAVGGLVAQVGQGNDLQGGWGARSRVVVGQMSKQQETSRITCSRALYAATLHVVARCAGWGVLHPA